MKNREGVKFFMSIFDIENFPIDGNDIKRNIRVILNYDGAKGIVKLITKGNKEEKIKYKTL